MKNTALEVPFLWKSAEKRPRSEPDPAGASVLWSFLFEKKQEPNCGKKQVQSTMLRTESTVDHYNVLLDGSSVGSTHAGKRRGIWG